MSAPANLSWIPWTFFGVLAVGTGLFLAMSYRAWRDERRARIARERMHAEIDRARRIEDQKNHRRGERGRI